MIVARAFRKRSNYVVALATEALRWPLRLYARARSGRAALPAQEWRRALILGDTHVGDVLYRTGSLEALHRGLPKCELYYLTSESAAPLLETSRALTAVLPLCRNDSRLDLTSEAIKQLRAMRFDAALCTNAVHYFQDLKLALDLQIPARVGYMHKGLSAWVTHRIAISYPAPYPCYFRDFVAQLTEQTPSWPVRPVVTLTRRDEEEAAAFWQSCDFDPKRKVIACFVTSRQPSGIWPAEYFARAAGLLKREHHVELLLCGAKHDEQLLRRLNEEHHLGARLNAGRVSLRALVAVLRRCAFALTPDSGPRHLANAAGIPVVFVRNINVNRIETGAYCDTEVDLAGDAEYLEGAAQAEYLRRIAPDVVARAAGDLLGR